MIKPEPLSLGHGPRSYTTPGDTTFKMEQLPIAVMKGSNLAVATKNVSRLRELAGHQGAAALAVSDWLHHSFGIDRPKGALSRVTELGVDAFVTAVGGSLPKKRKLTVAEIAELKREYAAAIEPARVVRGEILMLERELSDLVNAAYGLTPKEVDLMWATAPPRMPLSAGTEPTAPSDDEIGDTEDES